MLKIAGAPKLSPLSAQPAFKYVTRREIRYLDQAACCAAKLHAVPEINEQKTWRERTIEVLVGSNNAVVEEDDVTNQGAHGDPAPPVLVRQPLHVLGKGFSSVFRGMRLIQDAHVY